VDGFRGNFERDAQGRVAWLRLHGRLYELVRRSVVRRPYAPGPQRPCAQAAASAGRRSRVTGVGKSAALTATRSGGVTAAMPSEANGLPRRTQPSIRAGSRSFVRACVSKRSGGSDERQRPRPVQR
jgi:hypothetical protein